MACGGEIRRPLFAYWMYIGVFWNSHRFCFGIRAATAVFGKILGYKNKEEVRRAPLVRRELD